jgi:hypothetical protein
MQIMGEGLLTLKRPRIGFSMSLLASVDDAYAHLPEVRLPLLVSDVVLYKSE